MNIPPTNHVHRESILLDYVSWLREVETRLNQNPNIDFSPQLPAARKVSKRTRMQEVLDSL